MTCMERHIKAENPSKPSNSITIYDANYYVMNSDLRFCCLQNGTNPENTSGEYLDRPTFTNLEP